MYYQINSSYPVGSTPDACYDSLVASIATAKHPKDPDTDLDYVWDCSVAQAYCICTNSLEILTKGNASDTACTFADNEAYYCVKNRQTLN
ncbi:MAG: hypothetical protein UV63_C0034G0003 [Microgenomates group bacterium GW2011_GWC1_43_11]|nr:MAG: hypothetical protein UV63_C0034G0003 [Microgenomates group bacterium GW2011_GWC1_43_11]